MYRSLMLVLMGVLACGSAIAEEVETSATVMGEVVVTASRQEEELSKVPANVTVISSTEIAQSPAGTVPELLRTIGGALVTDVAGNGRTYTVDLRGFGETAALNTLVLVDGRRINQVDLSGVDWSLIPKDRVERIEIVRGGRGSVLYGDNATGGVINIITKKGTQTTMASVNLSMGSYATSQGDVSVSGAVNDLAVAVNGNYRNSDGYRDNSDAQSKDVGLNLDYSVSDRLSLSLDGGYHEDETNLPGSLRKSDLTSGISRTSTRFPDDYADTKDWYLRGGSQYFVTENSYLSADLSTRKRKAESVNVFYGDQYVGETEIETLGFSPKLVLNEQLLGFETQLLLGFDYEKSEMDALSRSPYSTSSHELKKTSQGYFAYGDFSLSDKLAVSAGLRNERAEYDFKSIDTGIVKSNTTDEDLYTLGINYRFKKSSSVYASYSRSFRSPVLDELFDKTSNTVNAGLEAQTSDDFEVGLRLRSESGTSFAVNLFHVVTKNEIFYNPASGWFGANENLDGDSVRQGVELSASKKIYNTLFSGSYTYTDAEIDGGQYDGKDLPSVPHHKLSLGTQTTLFENVLLGLNGTYVGERRFISDFDNSHGYMDDYFYLTGKLSYLLKKGSLYIAVKNILDEEYSEYGVAYSGGETFYPSPEINIVLGAEFRF